MREHSLFWEIRSDAQVSSSYVFGTMHLGTVECLHHWPSVQYLIDKCSKIYTESSLDPGDMEAVRAVSLLPQGMSVFNFVNMRRWTKMRQTFIKYLHLDIDDYRLLHPLFLLTILQSTLIDDQRSISLDQMIYQRCVEQSKPCIGIESTQEQMQTLLSLDKKHLYHNLIGLSKNITKSRKKIQGLLELYRGQDIFRLYQKSAKSLGPDRMTLLTKRNEVLAQRIFFTHQQSPAFYTFGAGHLAGGQGVLRLLKQHGATIRPWYPS